MNKYYKNLTDRQIDIKLFGVGNVSVPANAGCVELAQSTAEVINKRAYPAVVLAEITPKITAEEDVIAPRKKDKRVKSEDEIPEISEETVTEEDKLEDISL